MSKLRHTGFIASVALCGLAATAYLNSFGRDADVFRRVVHKPVRDRMGRLQWQPPQRRMRDRRDHGDQLRFVRDRVQRGQRDG